MVYNITNITNIHSLSEAATSVNSFTNGLFWTVIMLAIYVIFLLNLRNTGIAKAVASSSFVCLILSILLTYLNLISILFPIFFILALAGTLFYLRFSSE